MKWKSKQQPSQHYMERLKRKNTYGLLWPNISTLLFISQFIFRVVLFPLGYSQAQFYTP